MTGQILSPVKHAWSWPVTVLISLSQYVQAVVLIGTGYDMQCSCDSTTNTRSLTAAAEQLTTLTVASTVSRIRQSAN